MKSSQFCYWLQGYFEVAAANFPTETGPALNPAQVEIIRNHLNLVFKHELDPAIDGGNTAVAHALQEIHDGKPPSHIGGTGPQGQVYRC